MKALLILDVIFCYVLVQISDYNVKAFRDKHKSSLFLGPDLYIRVERANHVHYYYLKLDLVIHYKFGVIKF